MCAIPPSLTLLRSPHTNQIPSPCLLVRKQAPAFPHHAVLHFCSCLARSRRCALVFIMTPPALSSPHVQKCCIRCPKRGLTPVPHVHGNDRQNTTVKKKANLPDRTPTERRKLAERFEGIRKCYHMGVSIRGAWTTESGMGTISLQATLNYVSEDTARRYRQFVTVYTPVDLDALLERCERHNMISMHIYVRSSAYHGTCESSDRRWRRKRQKKSGG